ncbi:MAG: asparagine--tRNA ligase [Clostridia bacterium]|nr:asparagine--tRNA ligase [Clostridia bacterium]
MEHIAIKELYKKPHGKVTVCGWVRNIRVSKNFGFIDLNDGTFFKSVQIVFTDKISGFDTVSKLGVGASLSVTGDVLLTPQAKQPFEIQAESVTVLGDCPSDYPLQKKRHSFEFLRTIPHLRARSNTFSAVFRLRSEIAFALHKFFNENGFVYVHTPIITGSDCEGAGEMFRVTTLDLENLKGKPDFKEDFFGQSVSLTVSGQLEGETMATAFSKIYTFGPTFRAENSNTQRHAAEFWMVEPEIAFADLSDDMDLAENMLKSVIKHCTSALPEEFEFFNSFIDKGLLERLQNVLDSDFERITYTDAIKLLEKEEGFKYPVYWGCDLKTEHERFLTEKSFKKPVFVTDYPKEIKAFYMKQNDDNKTVAACDLLVPGVGELIGGSQREEDLDKLLQRMKELKMNEEDYKQYLDLRRFGTVPHAGFGLGFERAVMYLSGMSNIRDVQIYPRTVGSL